MDKNKQLIIYGAPGTGKSYMIDNYLEENNVLKENIIRVVFHYDYTYSDFIGYISPHTQAQSTELNYNFVPGPFTLALEKAFQSDAEVYLIIEELNRGNSPAIFGDIFQLLDRNENDYSEYPIINNIIREYLNTVIDSHIFEKFNLNKNEIILPNNFNIICTMNTADQNVFTIDTAFKRRFKMKYIPIDFQNRNDYLALLDSVSKFNIFNELHTWSEFATCINNLIDKINYSNFSIPEDKKLGQYFVEEKDISCRQAFCDKVIYYLKNDVFKYNDSILNDSYDKIYDDFVINNKDIFEIILKEANSEI